MQGRPTAAELVAAVAAFLDDEVLSSSLSGRLAFQTRVAVNVLRIVERELTGGASIDVAAAAALVRLPGSPESVEALAAAIREGEISLDDRALREYLIHDVLARIAVDSPSYPSLGDVPASWTR